MVDNWEFKKIMKIHPNRTVTFPKELDKYLCPEGSPEGANYVWYCEERDRVPIIAMAELEKDRYNRIKKLKVQKGRTISISTRIDPYLCYPFCPGDEAAYLAHADMLQGEKRSVYLLTATQHDILTGEPSARRQSLLKTLRETPAFLPIVR